MADPHLPQRQAVDVGLWSCTYHFFSLFWICILFPVLCLIYEMERSTRPAPPNTYFVQPRWRKTKNANKMEWMEIRFFFLVGKSCSDSSISKRVVDQFSVIQLIHWLPQLEFKTQTFTLLRASLAMHTLNKQELKQLFSQRYWSFTFCMSVN